MRALPLTRSPTQSPGIKPRRRDGGSADIPAHASRPRPEGDPGDHPQALVVLGRVRGAYGVRGWVRVEPFTDPPAAILDYRVWRLEAAGATRVVHLETGRVHGKGVVAKLAGCESADAARGLVDASVAVPRRDLPALDEGEYYWADLVGLDVVTGDGARLGRVDHLMATGANDVMVIRGERERLVPFVLGAVVTEVDFDARVIRVDWDPEF